MDQIYVGQFELYPADRRLTAAGKVIELGARAFDMLLVLVEHRGRLVTKDTLLERVWPKLIVDENNIPAQIASLRRALGAGAIRTVPGFGYRLELAVTDPAAGIAPAVPVAATREHDASQLKAQHRTWPDRLGPLVGRDVDLRAVQQALGRSCLVTIVGVPGVGKTRLAQEILAREGERPDCSVAWVPLGPVTDVRQVPSAIAIALGIALPAGMEEFSALFLAIEHMALLLVLDCAEHLSAALANPLAGLLTRTRSVRALVTSQTPMGFTGEIVYRLPVLPVPAPEVMPAAAAEYAAIELFAQRASAADRQFELSAANTPLVAEICRRLDGIPLAIELAAARVPSLGLKALRERLDDRFRLLKTSGYSGDQRHGALHTAFEWSYGLLSPSEQRVFDRLGTFAASFALKTAAACVADETIDIADAMDLIGRLVDRSLVTALPVDPPRYVLLETARFYALERLTVTGELQAAGGRMAAATLALLDVAYHEYWSLDEALWLHRFEPELDNVRSALDWAAAHDPATAIALCGSAWPLYLELDLQHEGRERYAASLALLSDALPSARVGRFWEAIASCDSTQQFDRARYAAELAAGIGKTTGDARAHYYALMQLALNWRGDEAAARESLDAARSVEDPAWPARLLAFGSLTDGALLTSAGRYAEARAAYQRALRLALTTSERQALVATVNVVELDIACGNAAAALQLGRPLMLSLRHAGRRETRFEVLAMTFSALLMVGELAEARAAGGELYGLATRFDGNRLFSVLDAMALLACQEGRFEAATAILSSAQRARQARGQTHRRPAEECMHRAAAALLDAALGSDWQNCPGDRRLTEVGACALALGLES